MKTSFNSFNEGIYVKIIIKFLVYDLQILYILTKVEDHKKVRIFHTFGNMFDFRLTSKRIVVLKNLRKTPQKF